MDRAELPFVLDGFLSSYKHSHFRGLICDEDWWPVMAPQVEKMIARDGWGCVVAFDADAQPGAGDLLGFAFGSAEAIGYVYVKQPFRRSGIARLLIERGLGVDTSSRFVYCAKTPIVSKLLDKAPMARFDPRAAVS